MYSIINKASQILLITYHMKDKLCNAVLLISENGKFIKVALLHNVSMLYSG